MAEAWRFRGGRPEAEPLTVDDALEHFGDPADGIVWLDLEAPDDEMLTRLDATIGLGEFLLEDLREGASDAGQRTKLQQYGDLFHVAVRDCTLVDAELAEREIDLVFGRGWLVSVRHPYDREVAGIRELFPVDEVRRRLTAQCGHERELDEGFVLWGFLDVVTDRYFDVTEAVDLRIDRAEEVLLRDDDDGQGLAAPVDSRAHSRLLYDTGRMLTNFRRPVTALREVVAALLRREDPDISDPAILHFRDVYDHLLGISEFVESQRDILAGLRDVQLTVVSNQMNRSMQQLAAWGSILIVATLITGVLGMNFRDQPDVSWSTGFVAVVVVMAVVTVPMYVFFKKRKGWL